MNDQVYLYKSNEYSIKQKRERVSSQLAQLVKAITLKCEITKLTLLSDL